MSSNKWKSGIYYGGDRIPYNQSTHGELNKAGYYYDYDQDEPVLDNRNFSNSKPTKTKSKETEMQELSTIGKIAKFSEDKNRKKKKQQKNNKKNKKKPL